MNDQKINIDEVRTLHWHIGVMCSNDIVTLVYLQELGKELGAARLAAYPETVKCLEEKVERGLHIFGQVYEGADREMVMRTFRINGLSKDHFDNLQIWVNAYSNMRQATL